MANNNEWNQLPNDFADPPEGAVPPFNAEHGFRRLRFAEINEGETYVIKRVEKFRQEPEEEWSYDIVYSYVRIVHKTDDEVTFNSLFTRRDDSEWEFNVPDPDLEEFPEETLTIEQVNEIITEEFAGGLVVKTLHHFYAPEPEANALSNASTSFNNAASVYSDPVEGSIANVTNVPNAASVVTVASDPYNEPNAIPQGQQSPALTTPNVSVYGTNSENNVSGGRRRSAKRRRRQTKRRKNQKTHRRRKY